MTNTTAFLDLRKKSYSATSFETGHVGYDRFLDEALKWKGSFGELGVGGWNDRSVLERVVPFLVRIEEESAESLGKAMLINAYCIPMYGHDWVGRPSAMMHMATFRKLFYDFTRNIPHARVDAGDVKALLTEIPKALIRDQVNLFEDLFFRSFPTDAPPAVRSTLAAFLQNFYEADVFWYHDVRSIIATHERLLKYLGQDPLELDFYRERKRVFDLAHAQAARFVTQLGPVHVRMVKATKHQERKLASELVSEFRAELEVASPSERGQMVADSCRALLNRAPSTDAERWVNAGVPFAPSKLSMSQEDLIDQLRMRIELTQDQACTILEYMARHGVRHARNYPALDHRLASTLARSLPVGRADLERLVKDTGYQTDQAVKDILIDALRGTRRGPMESLVRRFVPWIFKPKDREELWADWIDAKRCLLVAEIATRPPCGAAAPNSELVQDWSGIGGQAYDLDLAGYAKRIALAQSYGADIKPWLDDLRGLATMIRANLEALETAAATSTGDLSRAPAHRLVDEAKTDVGEPSLFGLCDSPTTEQLIECERKTLLWLEKLIARIELCDRHSDLAPFEQRMRELTRGQDFSFHQMLFAHSIEQATETGVPEGFLERLEGFDFTLIGGPYIEDTEPCFTEYEIEAWRSSIQALAAFPPSVAGRKIEAVAQIVFAPEFEPHRRDYTFAPRGYRQDILAEAIIRTLVAMPWQTGMPTLMRLQERAKTEPLQKRLGEAVQQIKYKKERLS
jgi:hypothetical protein